MKVVDETFLSIRSASHAGGYKINLAFQNGVERSVDFSEFLNNSKNPHIRKYLNLKKFKAFSIENGNIQWNDYDLCFPVHELYAGRIE